MTTNDQIMTRMESTKQLLLLSTTDATTATTTTTASTASTAMTSKRRTASSDDIAVDDDGQPDKKRRVVGDNDLARVSSTDKHDVDGGVDADDVEQDENVVQIYDGATRLPIATDRVRLHVYSMMHCINVDACSCMSACHAYMYVCTQAAQAQWAALRSSETSRPDDNARWNAITASLDRVRYCVRACICVDVVCTAAAQHRSGVCRCRARHGRRHRRANARGLAHESCVHVHCICITFTHTVVNRTRQRARLVRATGQRGAVGPLGARRARRSRRR